MSSPAAVSIARLEAIVGLDHVTSDPARLADYEMDGVLPIAAVRPASAEEVTEIIRFAAAEKLAVIPCGNRTKLCMGALPQRYDLAIDLSRLNRVVSYDPDDLTLSVEAGIGLAKLASVLAEHKQLLPLAVPFTKQATVGGTIATNVDSPLRQFYGTARDFVLGVEFVTGDGLTARSGGRVVKNVAGYDLHKLMIGSLGTLGVLTRVNFKTFPLPPPSRGFLASFSDAASALDLRRRIVESPLQPLTLDILSPELAQLFAHKTPRSLGEDLPLPGPWFPTSGWTLLAGFSGNPQAMERYENELSRMAREAGAAGTVLLGNEERPLVWGRLRECIPMLLETSPAATVVKISVLPTQLGQMLDALQQMVAERPIPSATLVRSVGVIYFALRPETNSPETIRRLAGVGTRIFQAAAALGGHAVVPWCPAALKREVHVWGPPREDLALMQKVKKVFDPHNILSPGRFCGGI